MYDPAGRFAANVLESLAARRGRLLALEPCSRGRHQDVASGRAHRCTASDRVYCMASWLWCSSRAAMRRMANMRPWVRRRRPRRLGAMARMSPRACPGRAPPRPMARHRAGPPRRALTDPLPTAIDPRGRARPRHPPTRLTRRRRTSMRSMRSKASTRGTGRRWIRRQAVRWLCGYDRPRPGGDGRDRGTA